jgi:methionyl-tRNA formyltransferase
MRVVFMGTPEFAVPTLTEIIGQGHEVVAVYTRAPRPAGRRGLELTPSPVQATAERFGLPVETPATLRDGDAQARLAAYEPEIIVVVAYGLILPQAVLDLPPEGCLNLHGSLLPRWRGAAPIQRAIMAGDAETGVMVMKMEAGLDTGPVGMVERVAISPSVTTGELTERLARLGADLMVRALAAASRGGLTFTPQAAEGVTYAAKIDKAEARIDWTRPAKTVHDLVRGLSPFPGAWCEIEVAGQPTRVKVLKTALATGAGPAGTVLDDALTIACGDGAVRLIEVQKAGAKPMPAALFLAGSPVPAGARLN